MEKEFLCENLLGGDLFADCETGGRITFRQMLGDGCEDCTCKEMGHVLCLLLLVLSILLCSCCDTSF